VREIVESAQARATVIEDQALERAAELERESQESANELFHVSVERSDRMLEAIDALEREIAAVISLLREEAEKLAEELRAGRVKHEDVPRGVPEQETEAETPLEEAGGDEGEYEVEAETESAPEATNGGSPEVREMLHKQITQLYESGKPREDAQHFLLRFKQGEYYLDMVEEVYGSDEEDQHPPKPSASRRRGLRRRRAKEKHQQQSEGD